MNSLQTYSINKLSISKLRKYYYHILILMIALFPYYRLEMSR